MLRLPPFPAVTRISHAGRRSSGFSAGSLAAYRAAYDAGSRHVQVDVVAIGDGHLASTHRIFGRDRSWESSTIEQLRVAGHDVASLDEIVAALPEACFNIEVKSRRTVPALIATIDRLDLSGRVAISSPFHCSIGTALRRHFGDDLYLCAPLLHGAAVGRPIVPTRGATYNGVQLWSFVTRSRRQLRWAQAHGWDVHIWPVNSTRTETRFRTWGANAVITDDASNLDATSGTQRC
jgi:glycerophosphoryl diester phosphodiesterase